MAADELGIPYLDTTWYVRKMFAFVVAFDEDRQDVVVRSKVVTSNGARRIICLIRESSRFGLCKNAEPCFFFRGRVLRK